MKIGIATLSSRRRLTGAALTVGLVASGASVFSIPSANADIGNCGPGWACIIDPDPAPVGTVDYKWYYYGTYNIHNEYGNKFVCNQQTGWAMLRLYSGYNGTGTVLHTIKPNDVGGHLGPCATINMTPVNSVKLSAN